MFSSGNTNNIVALILMSMSDVTQGADGDLHTTREIEEETIKLFELEKPSRLVPKLQDRNSGPNPPGPYFKPSSDSI